jgi:alkaline phosphatase D
MALSIGVCASVLLCAAPSAAARKGFSLGVAAGDVSQHTAILWAHAKKAGKASIELQRNGRPRCDEGARGEKTVKSKKSNDFTIQKKVKGLRSGAEYAFRFCFGETASEVGEFETAPAKNKSKAVRFAFTGDTDSQPAPGQKKPFWNNFDIFRRMEKENNDFNVHLGDTIYTDTEVPGVPTNQIALTVKQKWGKYARNLKQDKLASLRGSAGFYSQWDDHEFINDFARGMSEFDGTSQIPGAGPTVINGETLYQRGVRAFRDYAPVGYSKANGLYRSFRWGKHVQLFFLDERSFRSNPADYQGTCNNPSTGSRDLFPTMPQSVRNQYAIFLPSLATPVSQQCKDTINDPNRTLLGAAQLARFQQAVASSTATWKVIVNELPIQQYYADPYDRWEGYEAERKAVLNFLRANVKNVVFLTTDVHATFVNDARFQTLESGGPQNSGIMDITTGPAATATYANEVDSASFEGANAVFYRAILKPQPPDGVGMQCAAMDRFSYAEVKATGGKLVVNLKDIKGKPVEETEGPDVKGTCAPVVINAQ